MSHEVETMAWTNEVPWHGLGNQVSNNLTTEEMLKEAGLDWQVEKHPLYLEGKNGKLGDQVAKAFALVRDKDQSVLDVVGSAYTPVQNHEAFEFFREYVEAGDATMETAGSLRDGRYVWGLASLGESFTLAGGDEVKGYVLVGCPHEQGKSLLIKFTPVRVVCNNTLSMAIRSATSTSSAGVAIPEFRRAHRSVFDLDAVASAKDTLGIAREQLDEFKDTANTLRKIRLNDQDAIDILQPIFAPKAQDQLDMETLTPRLQQIMDAYYKAPGAQAGNGWGLLNAVTYYSDHMASRTADKRLTNAWFGRTAAQKVQTMEALLAA